MTTAEAKTKTAMNLNALAEYIENNVTQDQIDMENYFFDRAASQMIDKDGRNFVSKYDCNTVACALGHSVAIFPVEDHHFTCGRFSMALFGLDHFPALYMGRRRSYPPVENIHWTHVFEATLNPDKKRVVQRLRDKANELNRRIEK